MVIMMPFQMMFMKGLVSERTRAMKWTDKRVKTLQEVFGGMRVIKYFTWEVPMLKRVHEYRKKEMG